VKLNDGPALVPRPQGELYNLQYTRMSTCKRSGSVSVHSWGCISHCIEGLLDGLHYQNILQNVTVPCVWMLYPQVLIHLQQDHSSIHGSSSRLPNTHHSQRTDIHATGGIGTHSLSRRRVVDRLATGTGEISHLLIENEKLLFPLKGLFSEINFFNKKSKTLLLRRPISFVVAWTQLVIECNT